MQKLLNPNHSYNSNYFTGSNGTWKLIGINSEGVRKAKDCVDLFKNVETGEYIEVVRWKVKLMEEEGKIKMI